LAALRCTAGAETGDGASRGGTEEDGDLAVITLPSKWKLSIGGRQPCCPLHTKMPVSTSEITFPVQLLDPAETSYWNHARPISPSEMWFP
jgi:hypothetical protein